MDAFLALPAPKQERILNAALAAFGANGYKKTSVSDVAAAAGISKAMVFHYFGTKKALYVYLANHCGQFMADMFVKAMPDLLASQNSDFFARVRLSSRLKVSMMARHPDMSAFVNSMYHETDAQVRPEIERMLAMGNALRSKVALGQIDEFKFKDGIDAAAAIKMLTWMTEGYLSEVPDPKPEDIDRLMMEFENCMEILRRNLYKEEYL